MRRHLLLLCLAAACFVAAEGRPAVADHPLPLIPAPAVWGPSAMTLPLASVTRVVAPEPAARQAALLADWWREATGRELTIETAGAPRGAITLVLTEGGEDTAPTVPGAGDESWRLEITDGITVTAAAPVGLFRGVQALRQLVLAGSPRGDLHGGRIAGRPHHRWRGFMLDSGRHLQDVAFILELIDRIALYGFNVLHWHLTEDQGWRLEVPGHPALTEVGAWRAAAGGGRYGGYYTADDVRRVVAHAAARFVTVVPEIELPGHATAALAAYPELSCTGGPFEVQTQWGIHADVFCAGNDAVFALLGDVFDHVVTLFPGQYVHIGGDEVPKDRWLACPKCLARIDAENLDDVHGLQSWFVGRAAKMLADRGRLLVGWDEILEGGLPDGATVQSWRGTRGAVAAARAGHDAVVSPTSHAYLDYDVRELSLEKVWTFDPVPAELEDELAGRILGGAANLWTEYVPRERVHHQLFPRLVAMAEALGAPDGERTFPEFLARLRDHQEFWPRLGIAAGPASRPLVLAVEGGEARAQLTDEAQELLGDAAREVRMGASHQAWRPEVAPEEQLAPATGAATDEFAFDAAIDQVVWARLHLDDRPYGAPAAVEVQHSLPRKVALAHPPSPRYPGRGDHPLADGVRGGRRFDDGHWLGFEAVDLEATVDLGGAVDGPEVSIRCLQDANAWIFLPRRVRFLGSSDGERWHEIGAADHDVPDTEQRKTIREFTARAGGEVRYLRVVAENVGACPAWHPGHGEATWIFVDEIRVRP